MQTTNTKLETNKETETETETNIDKETSWFFRILAWNLKTSIYVLMIGFVSILFFTLWINTTSVLANWLSDEGYSEFLFQFNTVQLLGLFFIPAIIICGFLIASAKMFYNLGKTINKWWQTNIYNIHKTQMAQFYGKTQSDLTIAEQFKLIGIVLLRVLGLLTPYALLMGVFDIFTPSKPFVMFYLAWVILVLLSFVLIYSPTFFVPNLEEELNKHYELIESESEFEYESEIKND